jgi:hypothetical protein
MSASRMYVAVDQDAVAGGGDRQPPLWRRLPRSLSEAISRVRTWKPPHG